MTKPVCGKIELLFFLLYLWILKFVLLHVDLQENIPKSNKKKWQTDEKKKRITGYITIQSRVHKPSL